jgi:hypothetical protein
MEPRSIFEILLIYKSHMINPIKQNSDFYNRFINYCINEKEFTSLKKALKYIEDIEIVFDVINKNKEEIYSKYLENNDNNEKYIIKIDNNLKFEDKEINYIKDKNNFHYIIKNIDSILYFSENRHTFFLHLSNDFWKFILNYFNKPEMFCINFCLQIKELFRKYVQLVENLVKKENIISTEALKYLEIDEFAFILHHNIIKLVNYNEDIKLVEKLALIQRYDPYYNEAKYSNKVDVDDILDLIDFNNKEFDKMFFVDFHHLIFHQFLRIK